MPMLVYGISFYHRMAYYGVRRIVEYGELSITGWYIFDAKALKGQKIRAPYYIAEITMPGMRCKIPLFSFFALGCVIRLIYIASLYCTNAFLEVGT